MVDKYLLQYPILDYYMPKHITRENINYTNSKEKKSKIIKEENYEEKEANSLSDVFNIVRYKVRFVVDDDLSSNNEMTNEEITIPERDPFIDFGDLPF